jgi:hypothetical protein
MKHLVLYAVFTAIFLINSPYASAVECNNSGILEPEATWSDSLSAGWLKIGDLAGAVQQIALLNNVQIATSTSRSLVGRSVNFTARGTGPNLASFRKALMYFVQENQ